MPLPDFDDNLVAEQGDAILRLLRADPDVVAYWSGGILDAEEADGYIGTVTPPALLVALEAIDLQPALSGYGTLQTFWRLTSVTAKRNVIGTSRWLRARTMMRIAKVLWGEERGILRNPVIPPALVGEPLTEAIVGYQRFANPRFGIDETIRVDMVIGYEATILVDTMMFAP